MKNTNKYELLRKMDEANMNRVQLAAQIPCSPNTLGTKVNGKKPFNTYEIGRICEILNIVDATEKSTIFLR